MAVYWAAMWGCAMVELSVIEWAVSTAGLKDGMSADMWDEVMAGLMVVSMECAMADKKVEVKANERVDLTVDDLVEC